MVSYELNSNRIILIITESEIPANPKNHKNPS